MTAMIWKEIRENLHWAVLWLLSVSLGAALTVPVVTQQGQESLCSPAFQIVFVLGSALGGLMLGMLQTVPEMRRSQWAFLVHRPATRTSLFLGKVIGGLILYLPAMGLPLLGAALWAATPGHIAAPFDWRMTEPGIADILAGVAFYLAGLVTGLRPARWYGSRGLPIAAAVPCMLLTFGVPEFWQAVLACAGYALVLGLAAWGSFLTAGEYAGQPRAAKPALCLTILAGVLVVGAAGLGLVVSLLPDASGEYSQYFVDQHGTIIRTTSVGGATIRVTDLAGNELAEYRDPRVRARLYSQVLQPTSVVGDRPGTTSYRLSERHFIRFADQESVSWYYLLSRGRMAGYSWNERRMIGSLGPDGFAPPGAGGVAGFEDAHPPNWWNYNGLLACSHAVYRVDFFERRVRLLYSVGTDDEICGAGEMRIGAGPARRSVFAVATRTRVRILSDDGEVQATLGFHDVIPRLPNLCVTGLPDGSKLFLWYSPSANVPLQQRWQTPGCIVEVAPDGTELARHELPPLINWAVGRWYDVLPAVLVPVGFVLGAATFSAAISWLGASDSPYRFAVVFQDMYVDPVPVVVLACVLLLVSGLVGVAVTLLIARRYAFSGGERLVWGALGFLGGPAGVLTLVALRDWPVRRTCPGCATLRIVTRDSCEHCGAVFAPPARDGTEVFD